MPRVRPAQIETPGPGQESVWDYPRPPRIERVELRVRVEHAGALLADTTRALRVCETSSPPTYYLPPADVDTGRLAPARGESLCEWKGVARFWQLREGASARELAWSYPEPFEEFERLRDFVGFFAGRVDACYVADQRVRPQPGDFYGGWITPDLVGPFKGHPGSESW
ncbi:MAG: DUF427 domain-containing protein [bacterium]|nr:DUF427 domain-containing protein [bacterium]